MTRAFEDIKATAHFDFLYGRFSLSKWKIPYFTTTVSLEDAANDLHLTSEIPGAEEIQWSLDELYQRDIDWHRVEQRIAPYLRDGDNPQFFNSITIALLPYDSANKETLDRFGDGVQWLAPKHEMASLYKADLRVGPIQFGFWDKWEKTTDAAFRSGRMRWNKDQIFGVAIDGQHRLAAIKTLVDSGGKSAEIAGTRIPVILLVFDEQVGYEGPQNRPTVELLRRLFIDLNKHAQTVTRGRQILLDDWDPNSICVRSLLQNELAGNLDALADQPPRLPLSLVDWHSEQAKFDTGPYLTTVLGLDWLVGKVLETKSIRDFTDYGSIAAQIKKLQNRLGIDLESARTRLEGLESFHMRPFSYRAEDIQLIREAFADVWGAPLVTIFTKFAPYQSLISTRIHDGTLSLDHQEWFHLRERKRQDPFEGKPTQEYRQFLGRLATRPIDPISETDLELSLSRLNGLKDESLAFNVAFQRALLLGFLEYAKISVSDIDQFGAGDDNEDFPDFGDLDAPEEDYVSTESAEEEFADPIPETKKSVLKAQYATRAEEYVVAINRVVAAFPNFLHVNGEYEEAGGISREFWAGTLLKKPEDTIDFTQAASDRARDLIFLAAAMVLYDDRTEPNTQSDFDDFWIDCTQNAAVAITDSIGRGIARFSKGPGSGAGRAIRGRGEDYSEDTGYDEARHRLSFLWKELEL
jgi:hypothetical protein